MTERAIQSLLYYWAIQLGDQMMAPNVCFVTREADFWSVTRSGKSRECEIKISRSDFHADRKKTKKHDMLRNREKRGPNYFYYVYPVGLLQTPELPEYAGGIEVQAGLQPKVVKRAPLLHKEPVPDAIRERVLRSMMYRYWRNRPLTGLRAA